jgi:hypothetical protein
MSGPDSEDVFSIATEEEFIGTLRWPVLRRAPDVENADDTVWKYMSITIDQLEKLDFYQQHLDMVDLRLERRQSECLKRFEAALRMPVGYYYWGGKCFPLIVIQVMTCRHIFTI